MKPKVSVIIPTYNRAHTLKRALNSVFAQTYREFELIVVNDGSTDKTNKIIRHCERPEGARQSRDRKIASASPRNDRLRDIQLDQNSGVSHARNVGIKKAQGDWIAFLDSDDEWFSEKLEIQLDFFSNHPEYRITQTEEIWIRNEKRVNPMNKHKKHSGWIFKECLPLCIVSPSAVMIQKSLFDEVGFFDESLPACEDYDLWLRIAAQYPIGLIEKPLITKYGGHEDQLSKRIPQLDIYRIKAIRKILDSGVLSAEQTQCAREELKRKCRVYATGCEKRGKFEEAAMYNVIARTGLVKHRTKQSNDPRDCFAPFGRSQ